MGSEKYQIRVCEFQQLPVEGVDNYLFYDSFVWAYRSKVFKSLAVVTKLYGWGGWCTVFFTIQSSGPNVQTANLKIQIILWDSICSPYGQYLDWTFFLVRR